MNPLVVIPARLASTRLPGKPLAMIGAKPMIAHMLDRAREAAIGPAIVACDGEAIATAVQQYGGTAILTDPNHPSGSDRIYEALTRYDPAEAYDIIVNLQGDVPTLDPHVLREVITPLENPAVDISTLVTEITDPHEITNPSVVKAIGAFARGSGQAANFSRTAVGEPPYYHHIGVYAYRRAALKKFISLPPSAREQSEKLEQLRALDNGMRIDAVLVDTVPLGVDTAEDLEKARRLLS